MSSPIIYLNGFTGSGKLTIAQALSALLKQRTPTRRVEVIDNHQLIDPVEKRYKRGHKEYATERTKYRRAVFSTLSEVNVKDVWYIFTDCQPEENDCVKDHVELARMRGSPFYSVVVRCSLEENMRRVQMLGRGGGVNGKMNNAGTLRWLRTGGAIFAFGGEDELEVDVTELEAGDVARRIVNWAESRQGGQGSVIEKSVEFRVAEKFALQGFDWESSSGSETDSSEDFSERDGEKSEEGSEPEWSFSDLSYLASCEDAGNGIW